MKKRIVLLVLCVAAMVMSTKAAEWSGTGWALNQGYIVTNHHVIENANSIICRFQTEEGDVEYYAEVRETDSHRDLAILQITDPAFKGFGTLPYALKTSIADVGEDVFVLGYPLTTTMGEEIKLTTGVISSHSGYQGDASLYQVSAAVQPGNSGGPLFDNNGNIIGIVSAKHMGAENVSYAIKASYLMPLLSRLPNNSTIVPKTNTLQGQPLPQKIKQVKGLICYIICSTRRAPAQSYTPAPTKPSTSPSNSGKTPSTPYTSGSGDKPKSDHGSIPHQTTPAPAPTPAPTPRAGNSSSSGNSREYIRNKISEWGECRNVAITKYNGDLALHGRNGWAGSHLPDGLFTALEELNEANEYIDDVQLTEKGKWIILYGNNGFRWHDIPAALERKIRAYNEANEVVTSVTFNDLGDWIVITTEHYAASSSNIVDWLRQGVEKYGQLWAACVTDDGMVACYEGGYKFSGEVPTLLKERLKETNLDVYRIKIAGDSFFFADKDSRYRYKM